MTSWVTTNRKLFCLAVLLCWNAIVSASVLQTLESEIQAVYNAHADSIVRVKVATKNPDIEGENSTSLIVFSGFFVSDDGKVLTNATSKDTTRVWIEKDGLSYLADVIGSDEKSNLSLLQILNLPKEFGFIEIQENVERPPIGSFTVALTSPLEFAPSPSFGLVTGYESSFDKFIFPFTYTRSNIAIGPAEGGSPIFNSKGEFIGINTASMPEIRSSYSIPPSALKKIVDDFNQYGKVYYATPPFTMKEAAGRYNQGRIVTINELDENSSAIEAGLKPGDAIVEINSVKISGINQARNTIFQQEPGAFLKLKIQRDDTILKFALPLESDTDES
ncbi:S1C family serine protease [Puniceicoccaceae bacterium K14]|nr:S1C family serine protease [Puniceicoccaceae bacterium K14]